MTTLAICAAAMWIGWQIIKRDRDPGYVCSMCGARAADAHAKDCSWAQ